MAAAKDGTLKVEAIKGSVYARKSHLLKPRSLLDHYSIWFDENERR